MQRERQWCLGLGAGIILVLGAIAVGLPLIPPSAPGTNGTYNAVFRGGLTGKGTIVVTPAGVTIVGQVTDSKTGRKSAFVTTTMGMKRGHFHGTGLAGLNTLQIVGRVEPADGTVIKTHRVICTLTNGTTATRIIATK
jgi:hypothetical protein